MADRAILFIDGNNWYHSLREAGVRDLIDLDYVKISQKLVGPRDWVGTRYYIGRVDQAGNKVLYANQRSFLAKLQSDSRIKAFLGRLEPRTAENEAAKELLAYLHAPPVRIDRTIHHDLHALANKHRRTTYMVEKAVDVRLAIDMAMLATNNDFDTAYLLSADGDFTPAVEAASKLGKTVFVASPNRGAQLAKAAKSYIRLPRAWFDDCYA